MLESKRQQAGHSDAAHFEGFKTLINTYEHFGGQIGANPGLLKKLRAERQSDADRPGTKSVFDKNDPEGSFTALIDYYDSVDTYDQNLACITKDRTLATMFLRSLDKRRYGGLLTDLHNQHSRGAYQYPQDLNAAYALILTYEPPYCLPTGGGEAPPGPNHAFLQDDVQPVAGCDGVIHLNITCYNCNHPGHYSRGCPEAPTSVHHQMFQVAAPGTDDFYHELLFAQEHFGSVIPESWILLDSQSTVCVFRNKEFLRNIRPSTTPLMVHTSCGVQTSHMVGDFSNFSMVWYNPHLLANILSLAHVRQRCRVTMDTDVEPALIVHRRDGSPMKLVKYVSGLYYYDASFPTPNSFSVNPYSFVQTVAGNLTHYTNRQVEGEEMARRLYVKLGQPSQKTFEDILTRRLIANCPVTVDDAQ